jgi:serine/threonine protein kinase
MADSNYILGQVIARGGMAEVYRGLHVGQNGFKRLVAIKRILPRNADNPEYAEMFRDEALIGQRLQHANVVKVECFDIVDRCPSLIMEFIDGADLRAVLAEIEKSRELRRMPIPMAIYIIAEAARGLHYAHLRKDDMTGKPLDLVHRDISPQNILISFNGEVKVTDFGIATVDANFKSTETKSGIVKGKYSYMSPEQISAKKVDAKTDIFALAIVLWEVLAMKRLFVAENEVQVIEIVKDVRIPKSLREFNREINPDLEAIVLKALAKDPSKRYANMEEFEKTLRTYLSKAYPQFSVSDLVNMLKVVLKSKQEASQIETKNLLSQTSIRIDGVSQAPFQIELDTSQAVNTLDLTVSKLRKSKASTHISGAQNGSSRGVGVASTGHRASAIGHNQQNQIQKSKRQKNELLAFVAVLLVIVAGSYFYKSQFRASRSTILTSLRTQPANLRVNVNGKPINSGKFVQSPVRLRLESGVNIVEVSRPGYEPETLSINTSSGQHKTMPVVQLRPKSRFAPVKLNLTGSIPIQITLNNGFAQANLSPQRPTAMVFDLTENTSTEILVSDKDKPLYKCVFIATTSTAQRPTIVTIDPTKNRCDAVSGMASQKSVAP